jgi:hypothetical protein
MNLKSATTLAPALALVAAAPAGARLADRLADRLNESHQRFLENRRAALPGLSDPFGVPAPARMVMEDPAEKFRGQAEWHRGIAATVFWVGELPSEHNPTPNKASAWDQNWLANYGGYDDPDRRNGLLPAAFTPAQNPFYIALPYNDIASDGRHRPEVAEVIPWFWRDYRGDGISVCKSHWVAIHSHGVVCYAQWEDVGPFETNHWQYVFGKESPRPNRNANAGIDISPATRDYLGLKSGESVEWRFVENRDVPDGPWSRWDQTGGLPH